MAAGVVACAGVGAAWAQGEPDYGLDFVTVGAPGNRGTNQVERPTFPWDPVPSIGAVPYEFRITRTEVRTDQWLEFVNAYAPFHSGHPRDGRFTGSFIDLGIDGRYHAYAGTERFPIDPSWEMAARYCNWLSNGRVNEAWAFESGAYDSDTFTFNPDGSANHQLTRSPGSTFWIPSLDELIKSFYYDPNRNGTGLGGYWRYPQSSDDEPRIGPPNLGGTTNADIPSEFIDQYFQAGSYPLATTPWGLLDASGGQREWTESIGNDTGLRGRAIWGSWMGTDLVFMRMQDRIDYAFPTATPLSSGFGFRIASSVPSPTVISAWMSALVFVGMKRKGRT